jgi:hypothetical protein
VAGMLSLASGATCSTGSVSLSLSFLLHILLDG